MQYRETTQVPNIVFDRYLPSMTLAETRLVLIIIRQTYGWVDQRTGGRKTRDRISHGQLVTKTGLTRKTISQTIKRLVSHGVIRVTDRSGAPLNHAGNRKGRLALFYSFTPGPQKHPRRAGRASTVSHISEALESLRHT